MVEVRLSVPSQGRWRFLECCRAAVVIGLASLQHCHHDDGQLARNGGLGLAPRDLAALGADPTAIPLERVVRRGLPENVVGGLVEQPPHDRAPRFRDAHRLVGFARLVLSGGQSEEAAGIAGLPEPVRPEGEGDIRAGRDDADARNGLQQFDLPLEMDVRIIADLPVVFGDDFTEVSQSLNQRGELPLLGFRHPVEMLVEIVGVALLDEVSSGLAHAADRVDRLGALPDVHIPERDQLDEVVVLVVTKVNGVEELVGGLCHLRDHLRVAPVVLLLALPNHSELSCVADKRGASALPRKRTDPAAAGAGLHRHRRPRILAEERFERVARVGDFELECDLAFFVHGNNLVILVTEIHSDCDTIIHGCSP